MCIKTVLNYKIITINNMNQIRVCQSNREAGKERINLFDVLNQNE